MDVNKPSLNEAEQSRLVECALQAREEAYAPYSGFLVGAAELTNSGEVLRGCNVENASYGLTICAERVAVTTAVAAGHRDFQAIAIASTGGVVPCGACRQFLAEFEPDLAILLVDSESRSIELRNLVELLPYPFGRRG